ncbi:MAG TPA: LysM peptidoglycan-binding domain-containing protein [Planctomycetota bacterium]|nr:LysM peptidoglycan-binding domain-containing protein [Planctomycetota bacterium]
MNTQVKVGIAAAIVAALVALIVLDQKTTPKDDAGPRAPGGDPAVIVGTNSGADPASTRLSEEESRLYKDAARQFGTDTPKPPATIKGSEEKNEKKISPTGEEYVIKDKDTFDTIAQKHYGSKSYALMIAAANPDVKPTSLRVGKKIILPPKQAVEKKEEAPVVRDVTPPPDAAPKTDTALKTTATGQKVYTVQPGDTLSGISVKVYNTSRHYQKIYEANRDAIEDPNTLQVGLNLTMPELPVKGANGSVPGTGTAATTLNPPPADVPAGAKVHQVAPGDRLWNIAAKFAAERKIGILDMIKLIVDANVEKKIREDGSNLQAGWQLIIPE